MPPVFSDAFKSTRVPEYVLLLCIVSMRFVFLFLVFFVLLFARTFDTEPLLVFGGRCKDSNAQPVWGGKRGFQWAKGRGGWRWRISANSNDSVTIYGIRVDGIDSLNSSKASISIQSLEHYLLQFPTTRVRMWTEYITAIFRFRIISCQEWNLTGKYRL